MPKRQDKKLKKSKTKACSGKNETEAVQDCSTPGKKCK